MQLLGLLNRAIPDKYAVTTVLVAAALLLAWHGRGLRDAGRGGSHGLQAAQTQLQQHDSTLLRHTGAIDSLRIAVGVADSTYRSLATTVEATLDAATALARVQCMDDPPRAALAGLPCRRLLDGNR